MLPPWHQSGLGKVQQIGKLTKSLKVVWTVAVNELSFDILSRQGAVPRLAIWSLVTLRNVVRPCQTKLHIYLFFSQSKFFLVISTIPRTPEFHLNSIFFHDDLKESGARGGRGTNGLSEGQWFDQSDQVSEKSSEQSPEIVVRRNRFQIPSLVFKNLSLQGATNFFSPAATFKIVEKIAWSVFSKMLLFASEPH